MRTLGIVVAASVALSGCCAFMPCHPGLWAYGTVTRVGAATPVVGARISVFGSTVRSGAGGCFKLHLPDALPFEFTVKNEGDKTATSTPPSGHYRVRVELAPEAGGQASTVTWTEVADRDFEAAPDCGG